MIRYRTHCAQLKGLAIKKSKGSGKSDWKPVNMKTLVIVDYWGKVTSIHRTCVVGIQLPFKEKLSCDFGWYHIITSFLWIIWSKKPKAAAHYLKRLCNTNSSFSVTVQWTTRLGVATYFTLMVLILLSPRSGCDFVHWTWWALQNLMKQANFVAYEQNVIVHFVVDIFCRV